MTYTASIAVPAAMRANANALAVCLGISIADENTFTETRYQDASGNLFAFSSGTVTANFLTKGQTQLVAPDFAPDVDLSAASAAQAALVLWLPGGGAIPIATPSALTCLIGPDAYTALAAMGLTVIEDAS